MAKHLPWMLLGIAALLAVKYGVVGLDGWDAVFHPGLIPAPNQQAFRRPLFGLLNL